MSLAKMPTCRAALTPVRFIPTMTYKVPPLITQVFAGHDASRALGMTSTKAEDVRPEWQDLADDKKKVLEDWLTFFTKRYNIVGKVEGATNV